MRRAMTSSSALADSASAGGIEERLSSSTRRRSTARPRRMLSAAITVPIAVRRNTGATASWITPEISGTCAPNAMNQSNQKQQGRAYGLGPTLPVAGQRGESLRTSLLQFARAGIRHRRRAVLRLLRRDGVLLLQLGRGALVFARHGGGGADGHDTGND